MKLLLDENLPHALRLELPGHECFTVAYMGWDGLRNGKLLAAAADAGFDALLTKDNNLEYEQNAKALPLAIVVLKAKFHDIEFIRPLIPALLQTLTSLPRCAVTHVE